MHSVCTLHEHLYKVPTITHNHSGTKHNGTVHCQSGLLVQMQRHCEEINCIMSSKKLQNNYGKEHCVLN